MFILRPEIANAVAQEYFHPIPAQFAFKQHCHRRIQRWNHLVHQFNQLHFHLLAAELLRHLQADESRANDDGAHAGFGCCNDPVHVL